VVNDRLVGETDRTVPGASMTPRVFCKGCGYALVGLASCKCPECGRGFDLGDRRTFAQRPPRGWVWRWGRRVAGVVLLLLLAAGAGLFWLWWGWRSEQPTITQLRGFNAILDFKPIGPERLRYAFGDHLRHLTDRVERVVVRNLGADEMARLDFRSLSHIETLVLLDCEVSNSNLSKLAGLAKLRELDLDNLRIERPDFKFLKELPALSALVLKGKWVGDGDFGQIGELNHLEGLTLRGTGMRDADLRKLHGLSSLQKLDLTDNVISDAGLEDLKGLKSLRFLWIDRRLLDSAEVAKLREAIPRLEVRGPVGDR